MMVCFCVKNSASDRGSTLSGCAYSKMGRGILPIQEISLE